MVLLFFLLVPLSGVIANATHPLAVSISTSEVITPILLWTSTTEITPVNITDYPLTSTTPSTIAPPFGCPKCDMKKCPVSGHECSLNVGLVQDPCECCTEGVCGLKEGAKCYGNAVATDLLPGSRSLGACGVGMECVLRTDLVATDNPEALCTCLEHGPVCGSDNRTYSSSCRLSQETDTVWLSYRGPCKAAPWIVSPPEAILTVPLGGSVSLSCESKGYPTPRLHWERVDLSPAQFDSVHQPNDDSSISVQLRGGPEPFMGSTWLQFLSVTMQQAGSYACVAVNSEGEARALSRLNVISTSEGSGG